MVTPKKAAGARSPKSDPGVLGRSAATGGYVLAPASKQGAISLKRAKEAVLSLRDRKT